MDSPRQFALAGIVILSAVAMTIQSCFDIIITHHLGNSSYITNLDDDVVQHIEYVLYYYGARYYDPRTSIWISVDPIATYNPFEKENFIEGQHNGGVYNSFNHGVYTYCYQNPVKLVDPNGKQSSFMDLGYAMMGPTPHATAVKQEAQKLEVHAAKPAALSFSIGASVIGFISGFGAEFQATFFTKGPKEGTLAFYFTKKVAMGTPSAGGGANLEMLHMQGDERRLDETSLEGKSISKQASIGGSVVGVGMSQSKSTTQHGDRIEGIGLDVSAGKGLPVSGTVEGKHSYHLFSIKLYDNNNESYNPKESTNHYYLRKYTNLPESWIKDTQ